MYPDAEFLDSYDAGRGQRYFVYGVNATFDTVAAYYKQALKNGGKEIYPAPRMVIFELASFKDDRMAYPPSVVIKDYSTTAPAGYLFVRGSAEKRFQTVIQVVPPAPAAPAR